MYVRKEREREREEIYIDCVREDNRSLIGGSGIDD